MKNLLTKANVATGTAIGAVLLGTGVAGATPPDAVSMATDAAADLTPVIVGVGGALVAVAVTRFGVRWVLSAVGRGGKA